MPRLLTSAPDPGKRPALVFEGSQFLPANFVQPSSQGDDGRHHAFRQQLATEALRLGGNNFLRGDGCGLPLSGVVPDHILEIVNVVEEDPFYLPDGWVDITREGNIDEHQWPVLARPG